MSDHDHDQAPGEGSRFSEVDLRVRALESLLVDKGLVDPAGRPPGLGEHNDEISGGRVAIAHHAPGAGS